MSKNEDKRVEIEFSAPTNQTTQNSNYEQLKEATVPASNPFISEDDAKSIAESVGDSPPLNGSPQESQVLEPSQLQLQPEPPLQLPIQHIISIVQPNIQPPIVPPQPQPQLLRQYNHHSNESIRSYLQVRIWFIGLGYILSRLIYVFVRDVCAMGNIFMWIVLPVAFIQIIVLHISNTRLKTQDFDLLKSNLYTRVREWLVYISIGVSITGLSLLFFMPELPTCTVKDERLKSIMVDVFIWFSSISYYYAVRKIRIYLQSV